jgi:hypothetical protein
LSKISCISFNSIILIENISGWALLCSDVNDHLLEDLDRGRKVRLSLRLSKPSLLNEFEHLENLFIHSAFLINSCLSQISRKSTSFLFISNLNFIENILGLALFCSDANRLSEGRRKTFDRILALQNHP